jgi:hypothetical protein
MARMLSNPEFAQFMQDEAGVISTMMPETSRLVSWNGRTILVYIGANPITVNDQIYPDVYLTDVSDASQLSAMQNPNFAAPPQGVLDALPQAVVDTVRADAATAGNLVNSAGQALGAAATSIGSGLQTTLIVALVVLALIYLPGRR